MKHVDVLRDDGAQAAVLLEAGHLQVRRVRLRLENLGCQRAEPLVEALRVGAEVAERGDFERLVVRP
jgi:Mg-chelatase subunit ChlD